MSVGRVLVGAPMMIAGFALVCNQEIAYLKMACYFSLLLLAIPLVKVSQKVSVWLNGV